MNTEAREDIEQLTRAHNQCVKRLQAQINGLEQTIDLLCESIREQGKTVSRLEAQLAVLTEAQAS